MGSNVLLAMFVACCAFATSAYGELPPGAVRLGPGEGEKFTPTLFPGASRTHKLRGSDTNHTFSAVYGLLQPSETVRLHYHERESETFQIISGALQMLVGNEQFCAYAGSVVYWPKDTLMACKNPCSDDTPVEIGFWFAPPGIEDFFDEVNRTLAANENATNDDIDAIGLKYGIVFFNTTVHWNEIGCGSICKSAMKGFSPELNASPLLALLAVFVSQLFGNKLAPFTNNLIA